MKKNNFKPNEIRDVIITCIVEGGTDTGISGKFTGEKIAKIQDMLEEIMSWNGGLE
jgi:hypothetical protein|nr:MAG TPA: hypothetical protein [Caudoviricetes sp.]